LRRRTAAACWRGILRASWQVSWVDVSSKVF
jgi:hypothetical protein